MKHTHSTKVVTHTGVPYRWQAIHVALDRSDQSVTAATSPWFDELDKAERWLTARGLVLGAGTGGFTAIERVDAVRA